MSFYAVVPSTTVLENQYDVMSSVCRAETLTEYRDGTDQPIPKSVSVWILLETGGEFSPTQASEIESANGIMFQSASAFATWFRENLS